MKMTKSDKIEQLDNFTKIAVYIGILEYLLHKNAPPREVVEIYAQAHEIMVSKYSDGESVCLSQDVRIMLAAFLSKFEELSQKMVEMKLLERTNEND